jgi:integral membrane protein
MIDNPYFCQINLQIMLRIFKIVAVLEGISFLVLLANMLLIKPNNMVLYKSLLFPIGMSHGVLFIAYLYLAFMNYSKQNWNLKDLALILLGSLLPFGTFYIERRYLKNA